ncbi:UDP-glucose 4-epimerase Gal10 [Mytilinidion resinicola]|uniref:DNA-directed RNA polymerases I, II, and III subunit RPABC3 n=1 Tax=Mytilinidion resinicola TaxID=574789 RepID=A0A6A6Z5I4_9PEZI|nr:UDP-glucose 4-epimerase Gal10 [Mytilinidion resinicola]KAF2816290.1 UDP-glucose 4-epimerase Gal10 [Mytilinidion resinicola]
MADSQLFEETFTIETVDSQKYDRVSRVIGESTDGQTTFWLDINHELFPLIEKDSVQMVLASTLNLDGTKDEKGWRELSRMDSTLADMYDYVCHGKVYRFEEGSGENIKVYISFGGLLLYIDGPYKKLTPLRIDYVYMLLKK